MTRNKMVGPFAYMGKNRRMLVPIKPPVTMRALSQRAKNRLGPAVNPAIRFDEMDRTLELFARDFRETFRQDAVLKGNIIDALTGCALPPLNPKIAKPAFAIVNDERLGRP